MKQVLAFEAHFWVQIWTPKWGPELDHIFIPSFRSLLGPRFGIPRGDTVLLNQEAAPESTEDRGGNRGKGVEKGKALSKGTGRERKGKGGERTGKVNTLKSFGIGRQALCCLLN